MMLSEHFSLDELCVSSTADKAGIANTPLPEHLEHMKDFLAPGLEKVRKLCGDRPMVINSAYRNPRVNDLVGGTRTSAHTLGYAADGRVSGLSSLAMAKLIAEAMQAGDIKLDQLIWESGRRMVVHMSFDPRFRGMMGHQPGPPGSPIDWDYFD